MCLPEKSQGQKKLRFVPVNIGIQGTFLPVSERAQEPNFDKDQLANPEGFTQTNSSTSTFL